MTESTPEVQVRNLKNEVVETLALSRRVFDYQASESLLWEAVTAFRAGRRKGSHSTKTRAEVRGGGRKPWRQKGTGRARAGHIRSPLWRSGGVTFGPKPRNYAQSLSKKKRRGAVKLVLSDKLKNENLLVLDSLEMSSHKTRNFVEVMGELRPDPEAAGGGFEGEPELVPEHSETCRESRWFRLSASTSTTW